MIIKYIYIFLYLLFGYFSLDAFVHCKPSTSSGHFVSNQRHNVGLITLRQCHHSSPNYFASYVDVSCTAAVTVWLSPLIRIALKNRQMH